MGTTASNRWRFHWSVKMGVAWWIVDQLKFLAHVIGQTQLNLFSTDKDIKCLPRDGACAVTINNKGKEQQVILLRSNGSTLYISRCVIFHCPFDEMIVYYMYVHVWWNDYILIDDMSVCYMYIWWDDYKLYVYMIIWLYVICIYAYMHI